METLVSPCRTIWAGLMTSGCELIPSRPHLDCSVTRRYEPTVSTATRTIGLWYLQLQKCWVIKILHHKVSLTCCCLIFPICNLVKNIYFNSFGLLFLISTVCCRICSVRMKETISIRAPPRHLCEASWLEGRGLMGLGGWDATLGCQQLQVQAEPCSETLT